MKWRPLVGKRKMSTPHKAGLPSFFFGFLRHPVQHCSLLTIHNVHQLGVLCCTKVIGIVLCHGIPKGNWECYITSVVECADLRSGVVG